MHQQEGITGMRGEAVRQLKELERADQQIARLLEVITRSRGYGAAQQSIKLERASELTTHLRREIADLEREVAQQQTNVKSAQNCSAQLGDQLRQEKSKRKRHQRATSSAKRTVRSEIAAASQKIGRHSTSSRASASPSGTTGIKAGTEKRAKSTKAPKKISRLEAEIKEMKRQNEAISYDKKGRAEDVTGRGMRARIKEEQEKGDSEFRS